MNEKNGAKKILTAGVGYILGGILIKGIAFITTPIFSRLMTTEEFGQLNTYLSYESILAMLIGFQFAGCLKNAKIKYADISGGLDTFFSNLIALLLLHSAAALVLVNVFSGIIMHLTGIRSLLLLNLLVLNCFGNAAMTVYNSFVSLNYQYKKYVAISVFNALANVALSLLLIFTALSGDKSMARILGYVLPYVFISLYLIVSSFHKSKPKLHSPEKYNVFAYRFCAPLIPNGFAEVMLTQFGKLSVDRYCGAATMGVYSLAYNVYSIVATVKLGMDYIVGPFYFDKRAVEDYSGLRKTFFIYSRSLAMISTLIMLFSPEIIRILGDQPYYDARLSAIPLIAVSYFSFLCYMLSQEEYFMQKTYLVSVISVIAMVFNIVLCTVFVSQFEAMGAAFSTLISFVIMFLMHFIAIKGVLKSQSFYWKGLLVDGVFVTIMSIVAIMIADHLLPRVVLIIAMLAATIIFACKYFKQLVQLKKTNAP